MAVADWRISVKFLQKSGRREEGVFKVLSVAKVFQARDLLRIQGTSAIGNNLGGLMDFCKNFVKILQKNG
ncbi:MAG: hypothetical protein EB127_11800 [Alphaproteobacteria bacterium]|nr:hypothetical protein [Alphaproteobacteria bacterium]